MPVVPDSISTLELSKLWLHKALAAFETENALEVDQQQEQADSEEQPQSDSVE